MNNYSFELFGEDDLVYDVTKHELVPEHIILSLDEKKVSNYFIKGIIKKIWDGRKLITKNFIK